MLECGHSRWSRWDGRSDVALYLLPEAVDRIVLLHRINIGNFEAETLLE